MALKESLKYFISKYSDEWCYEIVDWCKEGKSIESWCAHKNIIPDVIPILMKTHSEFDVCVRVAYWKSFAYWESLALIDTKIPFKAKTLNHNLYGQVMRQRYKWVDGREDIMKELTLMTDEELEERARAILEATDEMKELEDVDFTALDEE